MEGYIMPNNAKENLGLEEYNQDLNFEEAEESLSQQLEEAFTELELSEEERKNIGNPESLGSVIQDEIWKQFANQIGLDITNETLIQKYDREHPETYDEVGKKVMQDPNYKNANKEMKEKQKSGTLKDEYTGKDIKQNDNANLDHTVSRKEIFENQRRKQAGLSTEELANKEENLNATNESLNKSKGAKSVDEYVATREQREEQLKKQNEQAKKKIDESDMSDAEKRLAKEKADKNLQDKLDADDEKMKAADKKARKAINKDIAKGAVKQTAKKAGVDALKTMAVSALMDLLKEIMNGFIRFMKSSAKSFKSFLEEMKISIKSFFSKILNFVKTGATAAIGTIVSEVFGPIVSMFKKLASLIKQGISSFVDAVKFLTNPENKNMPFSVKVAQVGKIIVAGLTGAGALFLGEVIEKALMGIPVMMIQIPLLGTLANVIGLFLASLISGLIGAIVLNLIDKFIAKKLKEASNVAVIENKNHILDIQDKQIEVAGMHVDHVKSRVASSIVQKHVETNSIFDQTMTEIFNEQDVQKANDILSDSTEDAFADMQKDLEKLL